MTERGRRCVTRTHDALSIGPSSMQWTGNALNIEINELAAPFPKRIRGAIRLEPFGVNQQPFLLDGRGLHVWRPIAPCARVSVDLSAPAVRWSGAGYFDMNAGVEPLEQGFTHWSWSRAATREGAAIIYDAVRREGGDLSLALQFDRSGRCAEVAPPPRATLARTRWRLRRHTRADDGQAAVIRSLEDTPFYSRAVIASKLFGEQAVSVHESLSLDRFDNRLVKMMLTFRMPRRASV
jgi:carotenoid 1,2-hydratase